MKPKSASEEYYQRKLEAAKRRKKFANACLGVLGDLIGGVAAILICALLACAIVGGVLFAFKNDEINARLTALEKAPKNVPVYYWEYSERPHAITTCTNAFVAWKPYLTNEIFICNSNIWTQQ